MTNHRDSLVSYNSTTPVPTKMRTEEKAFFVGKANVHIEIDLDS